MKIPCLKCGISSENLVWYKVNIGLGSLSYAGVVSVCEKCRKVIKFYPNALIRNEEARRQKIDKVENRVRQDDVFILSELFTRLFYLILR